MYGPCPIHAQLALVEVLSSLCSALFMLEGQLQEVGEKLHFCQFWAIFLILKILNTGRMEKKER